MYVWPCWRLYLAGHSWSDIKAMDIDEVDLANMVLDEDERAQAVAAKR